MRSVTTNLATAKPLPAAVHVASLMAPQEAWLAAGGAGGLVVTIDAPVPLDVSDVRHLGKGPGYEDYQARTVAQVSGRVSRFSEEVSGFSIAPSSTGSMGCARDGVVGLSDNRLAVLAEKNAELQLIDVSDSTVKVVPLGALENNLTSSPPMACYTPPPKMVAAMQVLVLYCIVLILYCVVLVPYCNLLHCTHTTLYCTVLLPYSYRTPTVLTPYSSTHCRHHGLQQCVSPRVVDPKVVLRPCILQLATGGETSC
jgi:hypothetical protein